MHNAVFVSGFHTLEPVQCHVHEQINMDYKTKIVQNDGKFGDEKCRYK